MRKGVAWYLLLAFAGAWIPWEILLRSGVTVSSRWFILVELSGAFTPAIAAIIVRKWITREGFGDAGLQLNLRKWPYYVFGLLLPFFVLGCIVLEAGALGVHPASIANSWARGAGVCALLLLAAIVLTPVLWGEEFGWRGYLQVRLFADRPLLAAVATGLIWGVWHYPLIVRGFDYPGHPIDGAATFTVGTVLISIVFGWLRRATGSVWATSLAHSATNAIGGQLGLLLFGTANVVLTSYVGLLAYVPLGLLCVWIVATGRLGTHPFRSRHARRLEDFS